MCGVVHSDDFPAVFLAVFQFYKSCIVLVELVAVVACYPSISITVALRATPCPPTSILSSLLCSFWRLLSFLRSVLLLLSRVFFVVFCFAVSDKDYSHSSDEKSKVKRIFRFGRLSWLLKANETSIAFLLIY